MRNLARFCTIRGKDVPREFIEMALKNLDEAVGLLIDNEKDA